jgi:multidrug resistance efflux pump
MDVALAGESTEYNIIRAPYDGIILEKYSEVGMVAGAGIPILRVTSNKSKVIKTYIDNALYNYDIASIIRITSEKETQKTYTGKVLMIQKQKDPLYNKNYIEIKIDGELTL